MYNLLITSYLEPEYINQIRKVDDRLNVIFELDLIPIPRYLCDHFGASLERSAEQDAAWNQLLKRADILFDFDYTHRKDLPELAPNVRWIQATSSGIGQFVSRNRYDERMPGTIFTTASGIHARPLAEFCIMAMIMHYKGYLPVLENQRRKHWERYAGTDLEGRTLGIIGLGSVGSEIAAFSRMLGMATFGTDIMHAEGIVDNYFPPDRFYEILPLLDVLVVIVPHTPQTEKLINMKVFKKLRSGAFFVNISRGVVVDENALIEVLRSGHLSGAAIDVFDKEPLPADSLFWGMPNLLVSPHSASTSDRENRRITDLFCDNLSRFLSGRELRNVLDTKKLY